MTGGSSPTSNSANSKNNHLSHNCSAITCSETHLIPEWKPHGPLSLEQRATRVIVYAVVLTYLFMGMSMVSDIFCAAIDHIITRKKRVKITSRLTGSVHYISIPIWNEAVAHLTLFVIGNCAPDILLTVIEVILNNFQMGELGPGVILGTGALNLFFIQSLCILVVEKGKSKLVHDMRLYFVTAGWMIFAYTWLFLIINPISTGYVEPWECVVTLAFYPILVVSAYVVERKFFGFFDRLKMSRNRSITPASITKDGSTSASSKNTATDHSSGRSEISSDALETEVFSAEDEVEVARQEVEHRQNRFLALVKEMRARYPNKTSTQIQEMAEVELIKELPKSLGYYRMLASKGFSGGGNIINKEKLRQKFENNRKKDPRFNDPSVQIIAFDPPEYIVMEDCGSFEVNVVRLGPHLDNSVTVDYETEDGSGIAGSDYEAVSGRLTFGPGEKLKHVSINIIDDDVFNEDTQFYMKLSNPVVVDPGSNKKIIPKPKLDDVESKAKITKVDDDHGGVFHFHREEIQIEEDVGIADVVITRSSGAKGYVAIPFRIFPGTAQPGVHFIEPTYNQVVFQNRQTEQTIKLKIMNEEKLIKSVAFEMALGEPYFYDGQMEQGNSQQKHIKEYSFEIEEMDTSNLGRPKLGDIKRATLKITENTGLKKAVDNIANVDINDLVGASSWLSQFKEAIEVPVSTGSSTEELLEEEENSQMAPKPSAKDYIFHVITVFWKILFACVPPPYMLGGWAAFWVAFAMIGIIVAVIADIAKQLGCVLGMREEVTAITFVSFGTSLPDMFASLLAAKKEETADAAVGHINGSCAVLVFLGLGLSWSVASFKQAIDGQDMRVELHGFTASITVFFIFALVAICVTLLRRLPPVRGELGGPIRYRVLTASFYITLWVAYIALSSLFIYCLVPTFGD